MEATAIVDFQGYQLYNKTFILKEVCILFSGNISHYIFLPPFDYKILNDSDKYQVTWLARKYHGLDWSSGLYNYEEKKKLIRQALQGAAIIYVKGEEKIKWLRQIIQDNQIIIINIEKIIECNFRLKDDNDSFVFKCYHHNIKEFAVPIMYSKFFKNVNLMILFPFMAQMFEVYEL